MPGFFVFRGRRVGAGNGPQSVAIALHWCRTWCRRNQHAVALAKSPDRSRTLDLDDLPVGQLRDVIRDATRTALASVIRSEAHRAVRDVAYRVTGNLRHLEPEVDRPTKSVLDVTYKPHDSVLDLDVIEIDDPEPRDSRRRYWQRIAQAAPPARPAWAQRAARREQISTRGW
jgi:hypothetical protein